MKITIFECEKCEARYTNISASRQHSKSKRCLGAGIRQLPATVVMDDAKPEAIPETRSKPGPKAYDIRRALATRLPAYDDGDGERIDAMFAASIVDRLLDITSLHLVAPFMFRELWGVRAPERFRSFAMYRGKLWYVAGPGEVHQCGKVCAKTAREVSKYMLDFAATVCGLCIPTRRPEAIPAARQMLDMITHPVSDTSRVTLPDALDHNETYMKHRTSQMTALVRRIEGAMLAELSEGTWTPHIEEG